MKINKKVIQDYLKSNATIRDIIIILPIALILFYLFSFFQVYTTIEKWLRHNTVWKISDIFIGLLIFALGLLIFSLRRQRELYHEMVERKKAERKVQQSRAQLQAVLDGVPDIILQVDNSMRILWANKSALDKNPDAIGQICHNAFSSIEGLSIETYCRWAMQTRRIEKGIRFQPAKSSDSTDIYWEGIGVPLMLNDGRVFGAIAIARNVTDHMQVEATKKLLASIVESSEDAIVGIALDGNINSWNSGAQKIFGFDQKDVLGESFFNLVSTDLRTEMAEIKEKIRNGEGIESRQSNCVRKDGINIIISMTISPIVQATGNIIGMSIIARDITAQKLAEQALIESEERYRNLFEYSLEGIGITKGDRYITANKALLNIFGYDDLNEFISISIIDHTAPESRKTVEARLLKRERNEELDPNYEIKILRKDGSERHIEVSAGILTLRDGNVVQSTFRDITTRKLAEAALIESEHFNKTIISSVGEGVIVYDENFNYKLWNKFMEELTGVTSDSVMGKPAHEIFPDLRELGIYDMLTRALNGETVHSQGTLYHLDNPAKSFWVSGSYSPHISFEGEIIGVVGIIRDITQSKIFEDALQASETKYRELFDNMSSGVVVLDWDDSRSEFIITDINKGVEKIEKKSKPDLLNLSINRAFPQFEESGLIYLVEKVKATGRPENLTFTFTKADNTQSWRDNYIYKLPSGEIVVIYDDITEQKRAEAALLESEERLSNFMEAATESFILLDSEMQIIEINREALRQIRNVKARIIGKKAYDSIGMFMDLDNMDHYLNVLKTGESYYCDNYTPSRLNSKQNFSLKVFKVGDGLGIIANDITERILAEQALQDSEQFNKTIISSVGEGIIVYDDKLKCKVWNKFMEDLTGVGADKVINRGVGEVLSAFLDRNIDSFVKKALKGETVHSAETSFTIDDERKGWINGSYSPHISAGGSIIGVVAIVRDVTQQKIADDELKNSREQLRSLATYMEKVREEERKEIAHEIHDELGQALTALKMDVSWLARRLSPSQEILHEKVKSISELIDGTINHVRHLSTQLRPSILDHFGLAAAIEWQVEEFQKRTDISCKINIEPKDIQLEDFVSIALFRIVQEALTNITRHAQATTVDVNLTVFEGMIELKIVDNGIGISIDQINDVHSFGLIGIRERANFVGGIASISGEMNIGTTICVTVPLTKSEVLND